LGFLNNADAIIKVTTTQCRLISNVILESQTGMTLFPGNFLFGDNFFQVNLAKNSFINPGAVLDFSVSYNLSATPVSEPPSLPLLASGLVALALACRAIRTGVRPGSGRAETA
jgi:hypothetical protein